MQLLGIFCLGYYLVLCMVLKRWNTTFSRFWIFAGCTFLFLGRFNLQTAAPVFWGGAAVFSLAALRIVIGMIPSSDRNIPYLVVLGAQVRGKELTGSLYRRVERARKYLEDNPETVAIVSGGRGRGEDITEALAMEQYLRSRGIEKRRIIKEDRSRTTEENLRYSAEYIRDMGAPVGIVTNNYHMYRACCYARKLGYRNPKALPAGCLPVCFLNYMVREIFALIKMLV